ncbi:Glycogen accumulation regulator GarA [compost metagenome]
MAQMLKLHFKDRRQAPMWLVDARFTIGQDRRNQLVVSDPGVGAVHAEIRQQDGHYYLSECDGGTLVNGERISGAYPLRPGDELRLGSLELLLLEPDKPQPRPDATVRWFLQVQSGEALGRKFHVQPGSMSFGRSNKCELCFGDPELSRRHCEFFLKDDVLEVKDLASANGVYVNREKIDTAVLRPGDEVRMGSVSLLVIGPRVGAQAAEPPADEEDATLFMPALELPKPVKPKTDGPRPTANPLRAATGDAPLAAAEAKGGSTLRVIALLAGGAVLLAGALAVLLV